MGLRTLSIETLCVLKLDKHSYEIHINLSFICLTLLCLICALSLYLAQKLLRKVKIPQVCKNRKKLLQMPKCAQNISVTPGCAMCVTFFFLNNCEQSLVLCLATKQNYPLEA